MEGHRREIWEEIECMEGKVVDSRRSSSAYKFDAFEFTDVCDVFFNYQKECPKSWIIIDQDFFAKWSTQEKNIDISDDILYVNLNNKGPRYTKLGFTK